MFDGRIIFWSPETRDQIRSIHFSAVGVPAMKFSGDGRLLMAISGDGTIQLRETATGSVRWRAKSSQHLMRYADFSADARLIVTAGQDAVAIWDATALPGGLAPINADEFSKYWRLLAGDDGEAAHKAIWRLTSSPRIAIPGLAKELHAIKPIDREALKALITDLESSSFAARNNARNELLKLGRQAVMGLRRYLKSTPTAEGTRSANEIIRELEQNGPRGALLQGVRGTEVLERIGTAEAQRVLESLAKGDLNCDITNSAAEALTRLRKQGK
jgi:hypothetical protein